MLNIGIFFFFYIFFSPIFNLYFVIWVLAIALLHRYSSVRSISASLEL